MNDVMSISSETYFLSLIANTSTPITLTAAGTKAQNCIVYNKGTTDVFVTSGIASPTAIYPTSATVPVLGQVVGPGLTMSYSKPTDHAFISAIRPDATTGSVVVTVGGGK